MKKFGNKFNKRKYMRTKKRYLKKAKSLRKNYFKLKIFFLLIIIIIYILFNKIQYKNQDINQLDDESRKLKVCVCTIAKLENLYIRQFVQHYEKYGVDKIFLYDNNDKDGERFEEVINDYIQKGFVEVTDYRGKVLAMMPFMNDCYKKNNNNYDWILFYEIDEYIHLYDYSNIKPFLNQKKFAPCQIIVLNLVCHTDNNYLYYENKPLKERFPYIVPPDKPGSRDLEKKTIVRGHINGYYINNIHLGNIDYNTCNNTGQFEHAQIRSEIGDSKYYYIDHYYSKSTEEFIKKITKGDAFRLDKSYTMERIDKYFIQSEITLEKIKMIEEKVHVNLTKYKEMIK